MNTILNEKIMSRECHSQNCPELPSSTDQRASKTIADLRNSSWTKRQEQVYCLIHDEDDIIYDYILIKIDFSKFKKIMHLRIKEPACTSKS